MTGGWLSYIRLQARAMSGNPKDGFLIAEEFISATIVGIISEHKRKRPAFAGRFAVLDQFCDLTYQSLGVRPADAGIGNGFSVDAFADLLRTFFQIGLDHKALYHGLDVTGMTAGMKDFFADSRLFVILLGGVGMVGVYDQCRI